MCWKVLQHKNPDDFVIATEKQYSVKFFVEQCLEYLRIKIKWSGKNLNETAKITDFDKNEYPFLKKNMIVVKISKKYFRPNEVNNLIGNANKAKKLLKWKPKIDIRHLIKEMIDSDLENIENHNLSKDFETESSNCWSGRYGWKLSLRIFKKKFKIINCKRKDLDFTNQLEVEKWFKKNKPNIVINAAGKVGGILDNKNHKQIIYMLIQ